MEIQATTPLLQQYLELKRQAPDALLFFRMGDFYELFGDDAIDAARLLDITLTSRDKGKENPLPMAGVPHHSAQGYIQKLLDAGRKVAIAEQIAEEGGLAEPAAPGAAAGPKTGKTIVRREIVRIFTPGIQFDREGSEQRFVACAVPRKHAVPAQWFLACLDVSTGETRLSTSLSEAELAEEIERQPIFHLVRWGGALPESARTRVRTEAFVEDVPSNTLSPVQAREQLCKQWGVGDLRAFTESEEAVLALGIVLQTVLRTQKSASLSHIRTPRPLREKHALILGPQTPAHLDLEDLFGWLNRTRTALGGRCLRRWLWAPLTDVRAIRARQDAVRSLAPWADSLSKPLAEIYDLERIVARLQARLASPKDTLALGQTLAAVERLLTTLERSPDASHPLAALVRDGIREARRAFAPLASLAQKITTHQKTEAPFLAREGGIFAPGFNPELDRLLSLSEDGSRWLVELEARERQATGIGSLKVRYNRVFGYYIEITSAHLKNVPSHYLRKQTMVGAERFFTEELKRFEEEFLTATQRQKNLELALFEALCDEIRSHTPELSAIASWVGEIDTLTALASLSRESGFCVPTIDESADLQITAGRHPLVDAVARGKFVPNSVQLAADRRCLLITGPNMGGKSTVMRQTALIVLLGQMGAPVPAREAQWGVVSRLYTRIGAHDAIAKGQSTFMVEMTELAHLLHHADERSLLILDEIGRGTSTYDGISVAWAALENICSAIRCRTLFATHYHELTPLDRTLPGLANAHLEVERSGSGAHAGLRFLYELRDGPTNDSFGIQVAQMAGIAKPIIDRAWQILRSLESGSRADAHPSFDPNQMSLFGAAAEPAPNVADPVGAALQSELAEADLNTMTPLQALNFVAKLQEISREASAPSS